MWTIEEATERIRRKGLKITSQRVGILKLLIGRKEHPSAEQVFREMKGTFPTISFATIYSTAQILQDAGLLQILTIDGQRVFFDPDPEPHAHSIEFRINGEDAGRGFLPAPGTVTTMRAACR